MSTYTLYTAHDTEVQIDADVRIVDNSFGHEFGTEIQFDTEVEINSIAVVRGNRLIPVKNVKQIKIERFTEDIIEMHGAQARKDREDWLDSCCG